MTVTNALSLRESLETGILQHVQVKQWPENERNEADSTRRAAVVLDPRVEHHHS